MGRLHHCVVVLTDNYRCDVGLTVLMTEARVDCHHNRCHWPIKGSGQNQISTTHPANGALLQLNNDFSV